MINVRKNQNILDICIQYYGDMSFLPNVINDNNISYTESLVLGQELIIDSNLGDSNVKEFYIKNDIIPANGAINKIKQYLTFVDGSSFEFLNGQLYEYI